ncbi:MAG: M1 family aminopeptidase, partial [Thermoanaerobaculia bacterium]
AVHLAAVVAALHRYPARYGPYPCPTFTIVHPPKGGRGAGGMEYPTLITTGDRDSIPEWVRNTIFQERVSGLFTTVHEFGHQYFQGLFASREHLEPWLDEGVNTFSNSLAFRDRYPSDDPWLVDVLSQRLSLRDVSRLGLRFRAFMEPVARQARDFNALIGNFGPTNYVRTGSLMMTLRNLVGEDDFDRALRVYCDRSRFRHPTGDELVATLVEELGGRVEIRPRGASPRAPAAELDVAEYLDQALNSTRRIDFSIVSVRNRRLAGEAGWRRDDGGELVGGDPPADFDTELEDLPDDAIEGAVVVHRPGGFMVPVELLVEFADGSEERLVWDAREPTAVFRWPGRRVQRASLDPDHQLLLEYERLDNNAFAPDADAADGLSKPVGDLAEAVHLALWGALGP